MLKEIHYIKNEQGLVINFSKTGEYTEFVDYKNRFNHNIADVYTTPFTNIPGPDAWIDKKETAFAILTHILYDGDYTLHTFYQKTGYEEGKERDEYLIRERDVTRTLRDLDTGHIVMEGDNKYIAYFKVQKEYYNFLEGFFNREQIKLNGQGLRAGIYKLSSDNPVLTRVSLTEATRHIRNHTHEVSKFTSFKITK